MWTLLGKSRDVAQYSIPSHHTYPIQWGPITVRVKDLRIRAVRGSKVLSEMWCGWLPFEPARAGVGGRGREGISSYKGK